MTVNRKHWLDHIKEVIRSRHYTWLPQGLGGESVEEAMTWLATDIMHICKLAGVSAESVFDRARRKFGEEEAALFPAAAPTAEIPHTLAEGIACRLDSQSQGVSPTWLRPKSSSTPATSR